MQVKESSLSPRISMKKMLSQMDNLPIPKDQLEKQKKEMLESSN
jgi:hypothetical protein